MGLPSDLANVASDSIPILLVALAAQGVCYIKSLLNCLLHAIGLSRFFPPSADHDSLPGFVIVDEHDNVSRRVYPLREQEEEEKNDRWVDGKKNNDNDNDDDDDDDDDGLNAGGSSEVECVVCSVCLSGMRDGEQVRSGVVRGSCTESRTWQFQACAPSRLLIMINQFFQPVDGFHNTRETHNATTSRMLLRSFDPTTAQLVGPSEA